MCMKATLTKHKSIKKSLDTKFLMWSLDKIFYTMQDIVQIDIGLIHWYLLITVNLVFRDSVKIISILAALKCVYVSWSGVQN